MEIINNPHDKYFKQALGDRDTARDFLTNYIPQDLLSVIDLESLVIQKESFIEKELQAHFSDIIYNVRIKEREAYLYLLFEHKSHAYKATALQLLKYMVNFWEHKVKKEKQRTLPPIIPLVFCHGSEKWQINYNLASISEGIDGLPESVMCSIQALEEIDRSQKATGYIETLIHYIISARENINYEDLYNTINHVSPKGGEMLMTIAEKLVNEGMEKGMEEGREEIKSGIHELLSDFGDYTQYKAELSSRLCDIKDLSKMKELFMTAARVKSAKEFIDRL